MVTASVMKGLKAVFHKFYLVHSSLLCLKWDYYLQTILEKDQDKNNQRKTTPSYEVYQVYIEE